MDEKGPHALFRPMDNSLEFSYFGQVDGPVPLNRRNVGVPGGLVIHPCIPIPHSLEGRVNTSGPLLTVDQEARDRATLHQRYTLTIDVCGRPQDDAAAWCVVVQGFEECRDVL